MIVDIKNKHLVIKNISIINTKLVNFKIDTKRTYINMKICREREICIYDSELLREGKDWGRGRYLKDTFGTLNGDYDKNCNLYY